MNIQKVSKKSYRITQMVDGIRYHVTVPYKPTEKDAYKLIQEKINGTENAAPMPFSEAVKQYIDTKRNILSPRTIREYGLYIGRLPSWFTDLNMAAITHLDIQRCVNELSRDKSPKTIRCLHGFITAVMGMFRPELQIHTTLPQKVANEPYIPTQEDVNKLIDYTEKNNPRFLVPIWLGTLSLRRSEICALTVEDLSADNKLTINKALVEDENKNWVVKTTKTTKSSRVIVLPQKLADMIRSQGYVYNGYPQSISNYMRRTEKLLGMQPFSLHKCRHFFASRMMDAGYDSKTIQEWGGWEGNETLSKIYQHSLKMKEEDERKKIADLFDMSV